jgi:hypothetical protein
MTALQKNLSFRPSLDTLEDRSLMTAASWSAGVLTLTGSTGSDRIHVRTMGSQVTVDGFTGGVPVSQVRQIRIDGQAGDDVIAVDLPATLAAKVVAVGGTGRDSLVASSMARPGSYSGFETYFNTGMYTGERTAVDTSFSGIRGEFEVDAPSTQRYNCIAWSLGITNQWINPPTSWADADRLNGMYGYRRMSTLDYSLAPGYEKIVLYGKVDAYGRVTEFTHQARQLPDGSWTSKLGSLGQVRHTCPDALDGNSYGVPVAVYYRYNPNFH